MEMPSSIVNPGAIQRRLKALLQPGIGRRLALLILVFSSVVTLLSTAVQLGLEYRRDVDGIDVRLDEIRDSYGQSLAGSLWVTSTKDLALQLDGILRLPDMQYLEVRSDDSSMLVKAGSDRTHQVLAREVSLEHLHLGKPVHLGTLRMVASLDGVYQRLIDKILVILVTQGIKTFLVSFFILFLFQQLVGRYLRKIATYSSHVAPEEMNQPLDLRRAPSRAGVGDELDQVAWGINQMRLNLKNYIEQLAASEERLAVTLDSIGDAVIATDTEGRVRDMNPMAERLTGWSRAEAEGRLLGDVFPIIDARTRVPVPTPVQHVLAHGLTVGLANHTALVARDGTEYQIADSAAPIKDKSGQVLGVVLVFHDVTEAYRIQEAVAQFKYTLDQTQDSVLMFNADDLRVFYANRSALELLGYTEAEILQMRITDVAPRATPEELVRLLQPLVDGSQSVLTVQTVRRHKQGHLIDVESMVQLVRPEHQRAHFVTVARDITERKAAEAEIARLAFYDPLTQLPNRRLLMDRLAHALQGSVRTQTQGALIFLDLDNFKSLNDSQGHEVGDLLLMEVARRMQLAVRQSDTVARLGGDEFVVMLEDMPEGVAAVAQAEMVAQKIQTALSQPYLLSKTRHEPVAGGFTYHCTASIGIAMFGSGEETVDALLQRSDLAMYQAKSAGRNTLRFFDPRMQAMAQARAMLEADMRLALQAQEFRLYYQVQVDERGERVGVEALLRWPHVQRGMVSPAEFIPLAEETGLILPLGRWVLETACRQLVAWSGHAQTQTLTVSVNVSARQFRQKDFVDQVLEVLHVTGAPANQLKLELTESMLLDDIDDVIAKMSRLRAMGVGFSLDDFGTGYSSLSYLKRLPLDQLKIDASFVRDLLTDKDDATIVKTIVVLGQSLGMSVIAEGVETEAQREFLARNGCLHYQGYLFGRPVPVESL